LGSNPQAILSTINYQLSTINYQLQISPLQGLGSWESPDPAVALRFTAGYAHHTLSGVKIEKQNRY
jgi:hypothetical protein